MNKFLYCLATLLLLFSCKKNCDILPPLDECSLNDLKIIDATCFDLKKYVIRNDSGALFGHATAIKSVPGKGEIAWISNNVIRQVNGVHYLFLSNFLDTSWVGLEYWAFRRENIIITFNVNSETQQIIADENSYEADTSIHYGIYRLYFDDFPGGTWNIDLNKKSYLMITSFDEANKIVEGEFDLHFVLLGPSSVPGVVLSDSIHFRCGHFRAKVFE